MCLKARPRWAPRVLVLQLWAVTHMFDAVQVAALQQARLVKARAEEAEAARRAKAEEIARRKELARTAKVRSRGCS